MRDGVENRGHVVISSWLDEPDQPGPIQLPSSEECLTYARRDYREVFESDLLLVDTLDTNDRGGREVEVGMAFMAQIPFWVVGPRRNVFHYLAHEHFPSWEEALDRLRV